MNNERGLGIDARNRGCESSPKGNSGAALFDHIANAPKILILMVYDKTNPRTFTML
eukprot:UN25623